MKLAAAVIAASIAAACSKEFEPYAWQDSCSCAMSDGGLLTVNNNALFCDELADNHVCLTATSLADAGCVAEPGCACKKTAPFTICD